MHLLPRSSKFPFPVLFLDSLLGFARFFLVSSSRSFSVFFRFFLIGHEPRGLLQKPMYHYCIPLLSFAVACVYTTVPIPNDRSGLPSVEWSASSKALNPSPTMEISAASDGLGPGPCSLSRPYKFSEHQQPPQPPAVLSGLSSRE